MTDTGEHLTRCELSELPWPLLPCHQQAWICASGVVPSPAGLSAFLRWRCRWPTAAARSTTCPPTDSFAGDKPITATVAPQEGEVVQVRCRAEKSRCLLLAEPSCCEGLNN